MTFRATCFGGLFVRDPAERLVAVSGRRADALLACLIWDQGRPVPRRALVSLLWPEREGTGAGALRQAVHVLRAAFGPGAIETAQGHVMLTDEAVRTDLARLRDPERAAAAAEELGATATPRSFLAGLREAGPEHGAWLGEVRSRADALAADALVARARAALAAGEAELAGRAALSALGFGPDSEDVLRLAVDALTAGGNDAAARQVIDRFQRLNGRRVERIRLSEPRATSPDPPVPMTHAVLALGLVLPEGAAAAAGVLRRLERAGATDVKHRNGTVSAFIGREGLRRSVVASALCAARGWAQAPPRPAVGLCLARLEVVEGRAGLREVDRARALMRADEAGAGRVRLDPALERLWPGAEQAGGGAVETGREQTGAFVGRLGERMQIEALWRAMATARRSRVLVVSGPPGIGKSRLLEEATRRIGPGDVVLTPPAGGAAVQSDATTRLLAALDPQARARRDISSHDRVHDLLAARDRPLMIVLEDAETFSDAETLALAALMERLGTAPILWAALARSHLPGRLPLLGRLAGAAPLVEIFLSPLEASEAEALAAGHDVSEADRAACLERAGANPLFLSQLLHHVADGPDAACPASVEEAVAARLAHLDAKAMACMRLVAVLGDAVPEAVVRELAAADADVVDRLVRGRLLRREDDLLRTEHGIIPAAIAALTPEAERRSIHLRAARWYRAQDPERHAWHLHAAGDPSAPAALLEAARVARRRGRAAQAARMAAAGRGAAKRKALRAALSVEEGLALVCEGDLSDAERAFDDALRSTLDREIRAEAWIGRANLHRLRDEPLPGFQALSEAERLVETEAQRARLLITKGRLRYISGRWRSGIEPNRAACRVARALGAHDLEAEALGGLADAEYAIGDMGRAEAHVRAAIETAARSGDAADAPAQHAMLSHVMIYNGRLAEGASLARETVTQARRASDWRAEINAQLGVASAAFCRDDLDVCLAAAERVSELAERAGADRFTFVSGLYRARTAIARNRPHRARAVLDALASLREVRDGPIHAPQFGLLRALTAEDDDGLADGLATAERRLSATAAHNALRVLPVAALLWRSLGEARRMKTSMQALRDLAGADRGSWAAIMHDALASLAEGDVDAAAARIARHGFRRMAEAMRPAAHPRGVMLVC